MDKLGRDIIRLAWLKKYVKDIEAHYSHLDGKAFEFYGKRYKTLIGLIDSETKEPQ